MDWTMKRLVVTMVIRAFTKTDTYRAMSPDFTSRFEKLLNVVSNMQTEAEFEALNERIKSFGKLSTDAERVAVMQKLIEEYVH